MKHVCGSIKQHEASMRSGELAAARRPRCLAWDCAQVTVKNYTPRPARAPHSITAAPAARPLSGHS